MFIYKFIENNNIFNLSKEANKDYKEHVEEGTIVIILLNYYLFVYYLKFKFEFELVNYLKWLFK